MRSCITLTAFLLVVAASSGCLRSRWAMRDPDYAAKYPQHSARPLQFAKRMIDARHVDGKHGEFVSGGVTADGQIGHLQVGKFVYAEPWREEQYFFEALYSDDLHDLFIGGGLKQRIQSPSRVAPFVGVGTYAGLFHKGSGRDSICFLLHDDDDHHHHHHHEDDFCDPELDKLHPMFAVYPEVGVHFWLNAKRRVTASASYYVTTEGRNHDYLFFNLEFSRLNLRSKKASDFDFEGPARTEPHDFELGTGDFGDQLPAPMLERLPESQ